MAVQIKLFYNIAFDQDKCQVIFLNPERLPKTYDDLLLVTRERIETLRFIPNSELRLQYQDDEGTLIHLREEDNLNELWRCSKNVEGTDFRRVKMKIIWQAKTTPEMLLTKKREVSANSKNKKQLDFSNSNRTEADTKKQRLDTASSKPTSSHNPTTTKYLSPLDLLIQDKQKEITEQQKKVSQTEQELTSLHALYGRKPNVDYMKPACTNCHRREGHNRVNCPYKGYPCLSAEFCGDLNKHKGQKDTVTEKNNLLQTQRKTLEKLKNTLASKVILKDQVTNSFSSIMRSRLINDGPQRYINAAGLQNWRQINIDLQKLDSHFKGKIPPPGVSLIDALEEYESKRQQASNVVTGNPMRTLWEMKGIKWPSSSESSSDIQDLENQQVANAIQESLHTYCTSGAVSDSSTSI